MSAEERSVTSDDVARLAGVSRTTVSYVLNNTPNLSIKPETREKVWAAARELNYQVHQVARTLRRGQSDDIYFIADRPLTLFTTELIRAMHHRAQALGYTLAVYFNDDPNEEHRRNFLLRLLSHRPAGVISMPGGYLTADLDHAKVRGVTTLVDFQSNQLQNDLTFGFRVIEIGRVITRYLLERGHRSIGLIAPQSRLQTLNLAGRLDGMKEELAKADCSGLRLYQVNAPTLDEMRQIVRQLQSDRNRPTAIYGFNDEYSFPLLRALQEQGIAVPKDIAIIGADNTPFCDFITPSLTSVDINVKLVGERAIDYIAQKNRNEDSSSTFSSLPLPAIIQREST
jgi:LacI family transcriptional regulator